MGRILVHAVKLKQIIKALPSGKLVTLNGISDVVISSLYFEKSPSEEDDCDNYYHEFIARNDGFIAISDTLEQL